ncbi:AMP-binding protein [Candidatus Dependentiae bacterium]|nr:AMP-binding protein [Candidatus Dependentiae bacterium]
MKNKKNIPGIFLLIFIKIILLLRYSLKITGLNKIIKSKNTGILFLPNHPALIDPVILFSILYNKFHPRPLVAQEQLDSPLVNFFAKHVNPISVPDLNLTGKENKNETIKSISAVVDALKNGDNVILYPSGKLYSQYIENIGANSSVEYILKQIPDLQIVLVRTSGLWGSSLSKSDGTYPSFTKKLKLYLISSVLNLFFFGPKRKVSIEFSDDQNFPRNADRLTINRYLENFYNKNAAKNTFVPYNWFQGFSSKIIPEPESKKFSGNLNNVSSEIQNLIINYLKNKTGITDISPKSNLSSDLGIDSISLADIIVWLEQEFNISVEDMESIQSVGDCIMAASGEIISKKTEEISEVVKNWFKPVVMDKNIVNENCNIAEIFIQMAKKYPNQIIFADKNSGIKNYRELVTATIIFKSFFEKFNDERIGIMLPASVATVISYFGILFSSKTPVMINWTVGEKQMIYSLKQTNTNYIVTSKRLITKIKTQGINYSKINVTWIYIEDFISSISKFKKITSYIKSRFPDKFLNTKNIKETAVILFTSGSENNPKSVPLSHKNIIQNIRDILDYIELRGSDIILGMLPPFHSFGITATMLMPLCLGIKTVFHSNPTEGAILSKIIFSYKVTMLVGTPTFVNGIMRAASKEQMSSVRIAATGAEKCSEQVYNAIKELCPQAVICEGYGITECSPVVSFNPTNNPEPGTIGKVLKSIEYIIINPETNEPVKKGDQGMLLVRGPSIFSGYLDEKDSNPFIEYKGKTWYKTGDLVSEKENGYLIFKGRLKRFIKIGGEMISLLAIENVLNKNLIPPDLNQDGPVFAVDEFQMENNSKIVLFTTIDIDKINVNSAIRKAGLSNLHSIYKIIKLDVIPTLGSGKTDYKKCRQFI